MAPLLLLPFPLLIWMENGEHCSYVTQQAEHQLHSGMGLGTTHWNSAKWLLGRLNTFLCGRGLYWAPSILQKELPINPYMHFIDVAIHIRLGVAKLIIVSWDYCTMDTSLFQLRMCLVSPVVHIAVNKVTTGLPPPVPLWIQGPFLMGIWRVSPWG